MFTVISLLGQFKCPNQQPSSIKKGEGIPNRRTNWVKQCRSPFFKQNTKYQIRKQGQNICKYWRPNVQNNWVKQFGFPFSIGMHIEQTAHGQGVPSSSGTKMLLVLLIIDLKVMSCGLVILHPIFSEIAIPPFRLDHQIPNRVRKILKIQICRTTGSNNVALPFFAQNAH